METHSKLYELVDFVPTSAVLQRIYSPPWMFFSSPMPPWARSLLVAFKGKAIESHESAANNIVIVCVAVVLCLTLLFEVSPHRSPKQGAVSNPRFYVQVVHEMIVERLEAKGLHHALTILHSVNKEMTIIGFIALLLFSLTRFGWIMRANDALMGQSKVQKIGIKELKEEGQNPYTAPTTLTELFEEVYLTIFFLMIGFFAVVGGLLLLTLRRTRRWRQYDIMPVEDLQRLIREERASDDQLEYWYLRYRFLNPVHPLLPRADPACSFSEYMSERLTTVVQQLVEIPITTWMFLLLLALLARPVLSFTGLQKMIFLAALSGLLCLCTIVLHCTLSCKLHKLIPPAPFIARHIVQLTRPGYYETPPAAPLDAEAPVHKQEGFCAILRGGRAFNSQEAMFCLGKRGPRLLQSSIQIIVFVHVVTIACLAKLLWSSVRQWTWAQIQPIWSQDTVTALLLCLLIFDLFVYPSIAAMYASLTSVGYFAEQETIRRSAERQQRKKMARDYQVAAFLQHKANVFATMQRGENLQQDLSRAKAEYEALPRRVQSGFQDLFHAFSEVEGETPRISLSSLRLMAKVFNLDERTPDCRRKIGKKTS